MAATASSSEPGRLLMPLAARAASSMANMFSAISSGGVMPFSMPSRPAARHTASAR